LEVEFVPLHVLEKTSEEEVKSKLTKLFTDRRMLKDKIQEVLSQVVDETHPSALFPRYNVGLSDPSALVPNIYTAEVEIRGLGNYRGEGGYIFNGMIGKVLGCV
jgi:hypothetical protein